MKIVLWLTNFAVRIKTSLKNKLEHSLYFSFAESIETLTQKLIFSQRRRMLSPIVI